MDEELIEEANEIAAALAPLVQKQMQRLVHDALARRCGQRKASESRAAISKPKTAAPPAARSAKRDVPKEAAEVLTAIKDVLAGHTAGLRVEDLREALGYPGSARRRLALVLRKAVTSGDIRRKGNRRGTTYFPKK